MYDTKVEFSRQKSYYHSACALGPPIKNPRQGGGINFYFGLYVFFFTPKYMVIASLILSISMVIYLSYFNIRTIFSYITAGTGCFFAIYIVSFWQVRCGVSRAAIRNTPNLLLERNSARLYRYPLIFFIRLTSIACNFARAGGGIQPVSNFTGITAGAIPIMAGFVARNGLFPFQSQYIYRVPAAVRISDLFAFFPV